MSDESSPHDSLPHPTELRHELQALAEVLRYDLQRGENPGAAFTRFATEAFQSSEDAPVAAGVLIEIVGNRPSMLNSLARVVDVAAELKCASSIFAREVVQLWDQPKDEHKLARLADEILTGAEFYQNDVARVFILDLARRLALHRPEFAARLLETVEDEANADAAEVVRVWMKCGAFLRTRNEAVRFFWERHLRDPKQMRDWSRSCVRPSVTDVRTAVIDEDVRELFRASVPEDVWDGTRPTVETTAVPIVPRHPLAATKPAMSPQMMRPAFAHNVRRAHTAVPMKHINRGLPWARIAAGVMIAGTLAFIANAKKPAPVEVAVTKAAPSSSKPAKVTEEPKAFVVAAKVSASDYSSKPIVVPAKLKSAPVLVTTKTVDSIAESSTSKPATPAVATVAPAKKPAGPAIATAAVQSLVMPQALSFSKPVQPHTTPLLRSAAKPAPAQVALASLPTPRAPVAPVAVSSAPPAPVESVARPGMITEYDRWVMRESHQVAQRYPELIGMQRAVVTGTWNDSIMRVDGVRPVTTDPERYAALVRWLVIDPPLPTETRKIVLRAWTKIAPPDECIDLWEQMLKGHAIHSSDISQAALELVNRPGLTLSANQRFRLHKIAAGEVN